MLSLGSFCAVYIFSFLFPRCSLLFVCVLALLRGAFFNLKGRCFEEGVKKLENDNVNLSFLFPLKKYSLLFPTLSVIPLHSPPPPTPPLRSVQYQCQLWRPRLTSLQMEVLKEEEGGKEEEE